MDALLELNYRLYYATEAAISCAKIAYLKLKIAYYDWRLSKFD